MKHLLKKYVSNRGAALFMVISTMTALLVSVMAMYFSMVSAKQKQYEVFNRVQATQTAQSVLDVVDSLLNKAGVSELWNEGPTKGTELLNAIRNLEKGQSITTGANGFKALDPNNNAAGDDSDMNLGAYSVTITYVGQDENDCRLYDVCVTANVDGTQEVLHAEAVYELNNPGPPGDPEIFAATGYVPNDAYIDGGLYLANMFFDTEFTYVGQYDQKANYLQGNMSVGGSLVFKSYLQPIANEGTLKPTSRPTTWSVRGDWLNYWNGPIELAGGSKIMVAGDVRIASSSGLNVASGTSGTNKLYVLGDLVIDGWANFSGTDVYVAGTVKGSGGITACKTLYYKNSPTIKSMSGVGSYEQWNWAKDDARGLSVSEVEEEIGVRTSTVSYKKWEFQNTAVGANTVKIKLNSSNQPAQNVDACTATCTFAYPGSVSANDNAIDNKYIGKAFTVNGFEGKLDGWDAKLAIVFDTGDDPDNEMVVRVKPYIDQDGDGVNETFAWKPDIEAANSLLLLVKGRGTLIIELEPGTVYQETNRQQFMHYSWYKLLGGQDGWVTKNRQELYTGNWSNKTFYMYDGQPLSEGNALSGTTLSLASSKYIHTDCHHGDGCSYYTVDKTAKVNGKVEKKTCGSCQTQMKTIVCTAHGEVKSYCPKCKPEMENKLKKFADGSTPSNFEGFCAYHVDHAAVDSFLASNNDIRSAIMYPYKGGASQVVYPNTDIYLVSNDESSDIRFVESLSKNGGNYSGIMQNSFYGFIYAPYLTFKGKGSSGNGINRLCGGMVVSDYYLNDSYPLTACYPDRMSKYLEDLAGDALNGKTTKTWKSKVGRYT